MPLSQSAIHCFRLLTLASDPFGPTTTRNDAWVLCGPDKASLRLGVRLGFRERLVALDTLLNDAGLRPKQPLKTNYTAKWLAQTLSEIVVMEAKRP